MEKAAVIKRTVEVSSEPAHLTVRLDQLLIQRHGGNAASIPCEDIGMLVVDQPQTTYSQAALAGLARWDAVLVVCGNDHLPAALLLPLADHCQVVWRVAEQVALSKPLRKQLWRQLVRAKIRGQAMNLSAHCPARQKLLELARKVRSGDPANVEAQAAKLYWQHWLDPLPSPLGSEAGGEGSASSPHPNPLSDGAGTMRPFHRDKDGDGLNALLNYGYAILRRRRGAGPGGGRTAAGAGALPRQPRQCLLPGRRLAGAAQALGGPPRPRLAPAGA